jgi:hypothetical protein
MNKPETQREWVEYVMKRQEYRERLHPGDHYARDWAYEYEGPVPRLQATGVTGWPCDEGWILFMHKLGSGESMSNYP